MHVSPFTPHQCSFVCAQIRDDSVFNHVSPDACGATRRHQRIHACAECHGARVLKRPQGTRALQYIYISVDSVRRASGCSFAILQSSHPLWSFEHSCPMTLCACVDALMSPCCTACVWWEHSHVVKYGVITYLRTYKATLMRRKHRNMLVCRWYYAPSLRCC